MMKEGKKNIIGLDLGTNSIGWAWLQQDVQSNSCEEDCLYSEQSTIRMAGSRIIPMSADVMSDFEKGNAVSQTKERTAYRMIRRMNERSKLRRERLNRVLRILGFLPEHYANALDRYGKLDENSNATIAWMPASDGKRSFLFMKSFHEMVSIFKRNDIQCNRIPLDWTLYYLRDKALREPISKFELAWVLHSFNQKRGYNQSRDEIKEKDKSKKVEYVCDTVVNVEPSNEKRKGKPSYLVTFENGIQYTTEASDASSWVGKEKEFILTTKLDKAGNPIQDAIGKKDYSVRMPNEDDWELKKNRTEALIEKSGLTVGSYIFHTLLHDPGIKIKGANVSTIDRSLYRKELVSILAKQVEFHPELCDKGLFNECVEALYAGNEAHRRFLQTQDISKLIINDIIFYQRPLKSKKSDIAECPFESRLYKDKDGKVQHVGIKCIPVSHPYFQEFRIWQFISNLRIYRREMIENGRYATNVDVSEHYLTEAMKERLFEHLSAEATIDQKKLLKVVGVDSKLYRWNYVEDKSYPCGETHHAIASRLKKANIPLKLFTKTITNGQSSFEYELWHILYSVNDLCELGKALKRFAKKERFSLEQENAFVDVFLHCPPFKKDYGAFSEKAIKRLLPLMRVGKYWSVEKFDSSTLCKIEHLMNGEADETISERVRKIVAERGMQQSVDQYQGLPTWLACYIVYNRHAEVSDIKHWDSPSDLQFFIKHFKQYSLRNPIVEQVSLETLRVVYDLWETIAKEGGKIDEIHLEMGRDLKNPADKRASISKRNAENEATNFRIKRLLEELYHYQDDIKGIRPYSPSQQELLRIYEETVWEQEKEKPTDILEIRKKLSSAKDYKNISSKQVERYRLWLDQKYLSPYTAKPIPLARLFTTDYEIEHVIPRSKYFDDSYQNKVICEAEVNKKKDNCLGMEFIKKYGGTVVALGGGRNVTILDEASYINLVNDIFRNNPRKRHILLSEEVNEDFSHRQLNDTRYIASYMRGILSNIVREVNADGTYEQEATSKNLIVCTGQVTDRVKQDWGLNDVWNHIVTPRFERLNLIHPDTYGQNAYGQWENKDGKRYFQTRVPIEAEMGFKKKRIDHRHHAMDAIAIACVNRSIVNYLSNASANQTERYDLRSTLCRPVQNGQTSRYLRMPWKHFTKEAESALQNIVVSFKQNLRILTKATNTYECLDVQTGKRMLRHQVSTEHYAIRKPLHKDTVYGEVILSSVKSVSLAKAIKIPHRIVDPHLRKKVLELREQHHYNDKQLKDYFTKTFAYLPEWKTFDFDNVEVRLYSNDEGEKSMMATRKMLSDVLDVAKISKKGDDALRENLLSIIEKITDTGIRKILVRYMDTYKDGVEQAFSPEGLRWMNENIIQLNDGKPHLPIYKVRIAEASDGAFPVGVRGNRASKLVKTAKDTNLFFAVYANEDGIRFYETISLRTAIEMSKQKASIAPEYNEQGDKLQFVLSPNDLVYVLLPGETQQNIDDSNLDLRRIYKMVSATKLQCFFVPYYVAKPIHVKVEYNVNNKIELITKKDIPELDEASISIKQSCIPLHVDRLGRYHLVKR